MKPIYIPPFMSPVRHSEIEAELLALEWETKRTARHEYFMADDVPCPSCEGTGEERLNCLGNNLRPFKCIRCKGEKTVPLAYSYGRADDGITYTSKPFSPSVLGFIKNHIPMTGFVQTLPFALPKFNGCFLNKYDDQHQHLGWHADDFEGMDPAAPIVVASFGAEREIWVKRKWKPCETCKGEGTVVKMAPAIVTNAPVVSYLGKEVCGTCHGSGDSCERVTGAVPDEDRYLLERGSLFIMPPGFQEVMLHRIPKHPQPCGWRISLTFRKFF